MSRPRFLKYLAEQPACVVPGVYVKPFVKRQSEADRKTILWIVLPPNDKADAEAIAEAAARPAMRFVAVTTAETQARASSIGLEPMAP